MRLHTCQGTEEQSPQTVLLLNITPFLPIMKKKSWHSWISTWKHLIHIYNYSSRYFLTKKLEHTSVKSSLTNTASEQSTIGTWATNVEIIWKVTKHFLKSLGSIPGRARLRRGSTWERPSGYHFLALNIGRDTATTQFIQAVKRWGSIRFSMAGYIL